MPYFIYILQSLVDGTYYIGSTQDLEARLERHNEGRSKYTKPKRPWKMIYYEEYDRRSNAARREKEIKSRKSRKLIEDLVRTSRQV